MDAVDSRGVIVGLRPQQVRRKRNDEPLSDRIKLKKVLGLTVCSNSALDVSPVSGLLAYPAGCTIVLYNAKRNSQVFLVNTSRKAFTAVTFSRCGRYLATGECGINPAIKVWELETPNGDPEQTTGGNVIAKFVDHKSSVTCVAFSPTGKYLVSVGSQHDMIVNVFDWKSNLKVATNKISSKVSAVTFSEDGSYFVTVGNRHVKYWYLKGGRKYDPVPLMGRSAILGDLRDNEFCAVACGKGACAESTYAITRQGHLVEFSSRRLLDKWVQCRTNSANCLCVNGQYILVGCAESIIRVFNATTLEYVTTLPRTHYLGVDVSQGIHINHIMSPPANAKFPDCIAMVFDEQRSKVSCVYNDHSLYIWDLRDIKRVGKSHSFLYHSTCIWGVETVPYNMEREISYTLPEDSFVTCSSDDTIRVWGLDGCANNDIYRKNIYSKELLKVFYIDEELSYIKDQETLSEKTGNNTAYDGRNGVRCIRISSDLEHLSSGDRSGNIRVYNLATLKLITMIEAHESEVLCLEYSNEKIERKLLASASRDRLIHVFDVAQNYLLLQTIDDHSSSITSIKFVGSGLSFQMISCGADKSIMFRSFQGNIFSRGNNTFGKTTLYDMEVDLHAKHILTACQDRNIRIYSTQNSKHTKTYKGSMSDEGSLIKLSLDPSGIYVATSCTDKTLAVYDCYSYECMALMYGHSELVTGLKFTNDCRHLISASGDGCIFVWQMPHDMIITMQTRLSQQRLRSGHAPLPRSISTVSDIALLTPQIDTHDLSSPNPLKINSPNLNEDPDTPGFKWSDVGQLPQWAKRKTNVIADADQNASGMTIPENIHIQSASSIPNLSSSPSQLNVSRARGRWAQRGQIDPDTLTDLRATSESPLGPLIATRGSTQTSDYNSASSKDIMYNQTYLSEDSSIDSGMETRRDLKFVGGNTACSLASVTVNNGALNTNVRLVPEKRKTGLRFDVHTQDHDGDVEDISDGERTSSDHGLFYNNMPPGTPTDFKVTAMNEEELRKSIRRQKFEKSGLAIPGNGSTHTSTGTGTGTGTSDTEDEGSTPSAENAERSLASTLGGSSESLPQPAISFLQAALPDGPGMTLERGSGTRRSISAKHNTEISKGLPSTPTITKSYTSTKKEELLKVISEAKQKLENVGYRSLRGSHSISDLSIAGNMDTSKTAFPSNRYAKPDACYAYAPLNSSSNSTVFNTHSTTHQHFFNCAAPKSQLQQSCHAMRQVQQQYPPYPHHVGVHQIHPPPGVPFKPPATTQTTLGVKNTDISRVRRNPLGNKRSTPSILKHYKSCPVSPVHEEVEWSADSNNSIMSEPKRHSIYAEDARTILDMIHTNTEKMISEITKKYGDLDDISLDLNSEGVRVSSTTVPSGAETPKRSISEYYIYQEVYQRKVALSDILQDNPEQIAEARRVAEARFLETQRHSSASFFLTSPFVVNSQESLLSDEFRDESGSYCNSLESILSDESDCKSAPIENPEEMPTTHVPRHTELRNFIIHGGPIGLVSKSYGNSPNAYDSFDYYMKERKLPYESIDVSNYTLDRLRALSNSKTYPRLQTISPGKMEDIPTMSCKNKQYSATVNRSLSQDFHANAKQLFVRKELKNKPPVPLKPMNLVSKLTKKEEHTRCTANVPKYEHNLQKFKCEKQSEEQETFRIRSSRSSGALATATQSCLKKVSKFDMPADDKSSTRRATSVRTKSRPKISVRFNTVSQIKYTPCEKRSQVTTTTCSLNDINCNVTTKQSKGEEQTFEMFICENGNNKFLESMDTLKLYTKPEMQAVVDEIKQQQSHSGERDAKQLKNDKNSHYSAKTTPKSIDVVNATTGQQMISTTHQCLSIAQKIDIIEKLINMEERKMEQVRLATETRMRPFECNSQQKGYVKSLTMNFDMLAKGIEKEQMIESKNNLNLKTETTKMRIKRNVSLPDVLESADVHSYMFEAVDDVEMGKEVKTDSDVVEEHDSEKIRLDCDESVEGTPKSLLQMPIEENAIRRACSLSDLYMGNTSKGKTSISSAQKNSRNNSATRVSNKRNSLQLKNSSGSLLTVPSPSLGVLNQGSDSETEEADRNNRLGLSIQARSNGPIATNRSYNNKTTNTNGNRRKGLQTSFTNATPQDDSSSEETQSNNNVNTKPIVPPRPRNLTFDHKGKFLNNSAVKQRTSSNEISEMEQGDAQSQVHNVINKLYTTTQTVMQLHANLKDCEDSLMLKELENAVIMTQNMLTNITQNKSVDKTITNMALSGSNNNNTQNEQTNADNREYVKMVNNCADLLSNFRWKHKTDDCEQNS